VKCGLMTQIEMSPSWGESPTLFGGPKDVRLIDNVLITAAGIEILAGTPYEMIVVD
jgi:hypothetical protein